MKNKVLKIAETIVNEQLSKGSSDIGVDAFSLSLDLKSDRSHISRILNEYWKNGQMIKIDGRPVFFIPVSSLKKKFPKYNFSIYYPTKQSFLDFVNSVDLEDNNIDTNYSYDINYIRLEKLLSFNKENLNTSFPIHIMTDEYSNIDNLLHQIHHNLYTSDYELDFHYITTAKEFMELYQSVSGNEKYHSHYNKFVVIQNIEIWPDIYIHYLKDFLHKINHSPHIFNQNNIQYIVITSEGINLEIYSFALLDFDKMDFRERIETITSLILEIAIVLRCSIELSKENFDKLISLTYNSSYLEIYNYLFSKVLDNKLIYQNQDHVSLITPFTINTTKKIKDVELLTYLLPNLLIINPKGYLNYESYLKNLRSLEFAPLTIQKYISKHSRININFFLLNFFYSYSSLYPNHLLEFTQKTNIDYKDLNTTKFSQFINGLNKFESIRKYIVNTDSFIELEKSYDSNKLLIVLLLKENSINKYYTSLLNENNIHYNLLEFSSKKEYTYQLKKLKNLNSIKNSVIFVNSDVLNLLTEDITFEMNFFPVSFEILNKLCEYSSEGNFNKVSNLLLNYQMGHDYDLVYQLEENSIEYRYLESELKFLNLRKAFPLLTNVYSDICQKLDVNHEYQLKIKFMIHSALLLERCIRKETLQIERLDSILISYKINKEFVILNDILKQLENEFNIQIPPSETLLLLSIFNNDIIV